MNWGFCGPLSHKLHDAIFGDFGLVENGRAFWLVVSQRSGFPTADRKIYRKDICWARCCTKMGGMQMFKSHCLTA